MSWGLLSRGEVRRLVGSSVWEPLNPSARFLGLTVCMGWLCFSWRAPCVFVGGLFLLSC